MDELRAADIRSPCLFGEIPQETITREAEKRDKAETSTIMGLASQIVTQLDSQRGKRGPPKQQQKGPPPKRMAMSSPQSAAPQQRPSSTPQAHQPASQGPAQPRTPLMPRALNQPGGSQRSRKKGPRKG